MGTRVGFLMDQVAGHVTNYKNLRRAADSDPELDPVWHEIHYYKPGGAIEKLHGKLPAYFVNIGRGYWEAWKSLHSGPHEALYTNVTVGLFFPLAIRRTPTLIDTDSTPVQLDRMPAYTPKQDPAPVAKLKFLLCQDHFRAARLIQVWSRWARDSVIDDYGIPAGKVVVNPPGIDLELWKPRPDARLRDDGTRRVLFVGGDFARKGGPLLLDWFRAARPRGVELHIVTREEVAPAEGVHVYRDVQPNSPQLLQLYAQSDLFVLPSLAECFGIATVEAMAAGLPAIASDAGGTADIIEPGRNGFIVPGNDARALGESILKVLEHPERRQAMAQESRALAEERFDLIKNARKTFGYLKDLARENRNARVNSG